MDGMFGVVQRFSTFFHLHTPNQFTSKIEPPNFIVEYI